MLLFDHFFVKIDLSNLKYCKSALLIQFHVLKIFLHNETGSIEKISYFLHILKYSQLLEHILNQFSRHMEAVIFA